MLVLASKVGKQFDRAQKGQRNILFNSINPASNFTVINKWLTKLQLKSFIISGSVLLGEFDWSFDFCVLKKRLYKPILLMKISQIAACDTLNILARVTKRSNLPRRNLQFRLSPRNPGKRVDRRLWGRTSRWTSCARRSRTLWGGLSYPCPSTWKLFNVVVVELQSFDWLLQVMWHVLTNRSAFLRVE